MFGKWFPGSRGDPTVPSGDRTDGTETTIRGNENGLFTTWLSAVPVGGSPTGAGESPAPPIFKTRSEGRFFLKDSDSICRCAVEHRLRLDPAPTPGVGDVQRRTDRLNPNLSKRIRSEEQ